MACSVKVHREVGWFAGKVAVLRLAEVLLIAVLDECFNLLWTFYFFPVFACLGISSWVRWH